MLKPTYEAPEMKEHVLQVKYKVMTTSGGAGESYGEEQTGEGW